MPTDQSQFKVKNPLAAMQPGEVNIFEVHRHPIGLLTIYAAFGSLLIILGAAVLLAPNVLTSYSSSVVYEVGSLIFLAAAFFVGIFGLIATIVYRGNRWILTSDSLTQIQQNSLFQKQSSQLSLGNLEDVTVQQDGILPHMFGYGVLKVETAGERSKFVFPYCPQPNNYAQQILKAREAFEQGRTDGQRLYRDQAGYAAPATNQAGGPNSVDAYQVPLDGGDSGVNINTNN